MVWETFAMELLEIELELSAVAPVVESAIKLVDCVNFESSHIINKSN